MVQLTVTNEYGQTGPSHFEQITIEGLTLGDINNDSTINILDVVMVIGFIIGTNIPSDSEFYLADYNEDGDVKFAIASDGKSSIGAAVTSTSLDGLTVIVTLSVQLTPFSVCVTQ